MLGLQNEREWKTNARVNRMAEVWAHPQLLARQRFRSVGSPAGPLAALLPPAANSSFDYRMDAILAIGAT